MILTVLVGSCSGADNNETPGPATSQAAATGQIDASFDTQLASQARVCTTTV